jgi:phosphopantothenoylcysteine decarboxylase/phosphopantothenate--cysteine ligase
LPPPHGVDVVHVRSAADMHREVMSRAASMDLIVMAAAVADYTPEQAAPQKIAKSAGPMTLRLKRTPDILADLGQVRASTGAMRPLLVGFAAETEDVIARARQKLAAKQVDMIVANDVSRPDAGFEVNTNAVTIVSRGGEEPLALQSKRSVAERILDRAAPLLETASEKSPR